MTPTHFNKPMVIPAESILEKKISPAPAEAVIARRQQRETPDDHKTKARKPHVAWLDDEVSSILAWICKNKESWTENKTACVNYFHRALIKGRHTEKAIYIKIRKLESDFNECFEFVQYKGEDKPVRRAIPQKLAKISFFKECRAAFGLPVYAKGMSVQKVDEYPPPKKEKTPTVATPTQDPQLRPSSDDSEQTKRAHPGSMPDTPPPTKRARRVGIVADDNAPPSQVESKDVARPDSPTPEPTPVADQIHARNGDQAHELRLKRRELTLLIQGTETKIKRSEMRFERLQEKHAHHQKRRCQRLLKYKEELSSLTADD